MIPRCEVVWKMMQAAVGPTHGNSQLLEVQKMTPERELCCLSLERAVPYFPLALLLVQTRMGMILQNSEKGQLLNLERWHY